MNRQIGGAAMFLLPRSQTTVLVICLILGLLILPGGNASAESDLDSGVLDGKIFAGTMGQANVFSGDDQLHFSDGKFWSSICIRCGYRPGKYWTRNTPEGTQFRGEMTSEFGTFVYSGQIKNGKATAELTWSRKRWYWTSSNKSSFSGFVEKAEISFPASKASDIATKALLSKLPSFCW
jgi:hypothetical protein